MGAKPKSKPAETRGPEESAVSTIPIPGVTETAADDRPEILITTREDQVVNGAIRALAAEDNLYQRGNVLVTVLRDSAGAVKSKFDRPAGAARIAILPRPRLREMLAKHARWRKSCKTRTDKIEIVDTHPPDWAVAEVEARGEWSGIRHLESITEAPSIRPDGSILDTPGWDEATGLLYEPNATFPKIPESPDREDARAAAQSLMFLACDFPFEGPAHEAAWLAGVLTPIARFAINGPCPLFAIDGNSPGTGKSKLTDIAAIISTGRDMPRTAYPDNDEEMRKRITRIAAAGDRLMLLDNIATVFGGSALDSALTASTWRDRTLANPR